MKELITAAVDKYIEDTFKDKIDIKKFLLRHERKDILIDNLTCEIKQAQHMLNRDSIKMVINDFTKVFCKAAIDYKLTQGMSKQSRDIQLKKRQLEVEENTHGEFEESDRSKTLEL